MYYGGGGGGAWNGSSTGASGGLGGGGTAGNTPTSGLPNTGGGGGGINNFAGTGTAGAPGGSGIVIVRYPVSGSYIPPTLGDPYFNNTVLLLHLNNNVTDTSGTNATITNTSVTFNNSIVRFGTHSAVFNGSAYLTAPTSSNFSFGTGNLTIEFWVYNTASSTINAPIMSNYTDGANNPNIWNIYLTSSGSIVMNFYNFATAGAYTAPTNKPTSPTNNTWTHLAFVRNGADFLLFKDGAISTNTNFFGTAAVDAGTSYPLSIGRNSYAGQGVFNGYIDDLRITKGVARYTSAFTVPQFAYPDNLGNQILEYPPAAMTGNTTTISTAQYANGIYTSSGSTEQASSYFAFDKTISGNRWISAINNYNNTSGLYSGSTSTTVSGTAYSGEWLQIQMPVTMRLTNYSISDSTNTGGSILATPTNWIIAGSNNGSLWTYIDRQYNQIFNASSQTLTFNTNITQSFMYYRIIVLSIGLSSTLTQAEIGEWRLFGY